MAREILHDVPAPYESESGLRYEVSSAVGRAGAGRRKVQQFRGGPELRTHRFPSEVEHAWRRATAKITDAESQLQFEGVPYGQWAISIYHDENANGELDRNFFGIPTEGIGASNNRVGRFSAPVFEDATFRLDEPKKLLSIQLRHH